MLTFRRQLAVLSLFAMAACATTPPTPALVYDPATTLGSVLATPPVAILAVGGTQQLSATGVSLTGAPVTTLDSVVYVLENQADTARIRIAANGLVTALSPSTATILVDLFAFQRGIAKADQALLQVTATPVPGVTLSIQPVAPDSAKQAMGTAKTINPIIKNVTTGASVANPPMRYRVKPADLTRVGVYQPTLTLANGTTVLNSRSNAAGMNRIVPQVPTGTAWIYAAASVYGTLLQDSVQYTFSYPYVITIRTGENLLEIGNAAANQILTLAAGATITFRSDGSDNNLLTVVYTFDNAAAATAATPPSTIGGSTGNVTALLKGQTSNRKFLTPGTYHWTANTVGWPTATSTKTLTGTIVIQ